MNKTYKAINILLIILFTFILILSPIFNGIYKNNLINKYILIFIIINILGLIRYIIKPYKIDKKIIYYLIFILTYFLPLINNITYEEEHYKIIILNLLLLGVSININNVFKRKDLLNKIVILSTLIVSLISMIYNFYPSFFNNIGIIGNYGDYYITSCYRLYGTFNYPNCLALYSLIGIILSLKYKNILYKIIIYLNTLTILLTMSKTILLFSIIVLIVFIIIDKDNKKLILSIIIPILINTNSYRNTMINNNLLLFIFITIILILMFLIIYKYYRNSLLIIFILIVGIFLPNKPLKIEKDNNLLLITEFSNLENIEHEIIINIKGNNIKGNIYLNKHYLLNSNMAYKIVKEEILKEEIIIKFKPSSNAKYYSLTLENKGDTIYIDRITLDEKIVTLDSYIYPFNYIQSLKQVKYDIGSVTSRFDIYKFSIDLIKQKPLIGYGFDYFKTQSVNSKKINKVLVEHSQIMTVGVSNGILGIVAWISLIIMIIINCIRKIDKNSINIILVIFLLIYTSLYDFSMSYHYFLLLLYVYSISILNNKQKDIMYICSTGGHLSSIKMIMENVGNKNTILITEKSKITNNQDVKYVLNCSRGQMFKYILVLPINLILNIIYFIRYNPKIIISTESHTGIFMCFLAKIFKRKVIFIEVYDRFKRLTLSGSIIYKMNLYNYFIVQHESLLINYPKAIYIGEMY